MGAGLRVSIIGESVLVEGIAVGLDLNPPDNVQRIQAYDANTRCLIRDFNPNVIIYLLGSPGLDALVSQIELRDGIRLIGLDLDRNQVLIVDSSMRHSLSMGALQQLIASRDRQWLGDEGSQPPRRWSQSVELPA